MVKSLTDMCMSVCLRHAKDMTDLGDLPIELARPLLAKIDDASRLRQIEINSPHLAEHTEDLWKRLIQRKFSILANQYNYVPTNPRSWHKIYLKYQQMDAERKREAEEKLGKAYKVINKVRDQNTSQVVDYNRRLLPRLPRDVRPQFGSRSNRSRSEPDQSVLRFGGGSRTKTNTAQNVLKRAMREAKEVQHRNRINTRVGAMQMRSRQLTRAPTGMVNEKVTQARPLAVRRPPTSQFQGSSSRRDMDDRLRQAKMPNSQKPGSYVADEDLDDVNGDDFPGLTVDYIEEPDENETPSRETQSRGSRFARRMNAPPAASPRKVDAEPQLKPRPQPMQAVSPAKRPTPASTAANTPSGSASTSFSESSAPLTGPTLVRKRKAVEIFMKPKAKVPRP